MNFSLYKGLLFNSILLSFAVPKESEAQISLSGGMSYISENQDYLPVLHDVFKPVKLNRYRSYGLQVDYTKHFFRAFAELGYLPFSYDLDRSYYQRGPGSLGSEQYYNYSSKVKFDYATLKVGFGGEFKKITKSNFWLSLSTNFYAQLDYLIDYSSSNHVRTGSYSTTVASPITGYAYEEGSFPIDYTKFEPLEMNQFLFQLGTEIKGRLGYKNYFLESSISVSRSGNSRVFYPWIDVPSSYGNSGWNDEDNISWPFAANVNIKVGYVFKWKPATLKTAL